MPFLVVPTTVTLASTARIKPEAPERRQAESAKRLPSTLSLALLPPPNSPPTISTGGDGVREKILYTVGDASPYFTPPRPSISRAPPAITHHIHHSPPSLLPVPDS